MDVWVYDKDFILFIFLLVVVYGIVVLVDWIDWLVIFEGWLVGWNGEMG